MISCLLAVVFTFFVSFSNTFGQDEAPAKVEGFAPGHRYGLQSAPEAAADSIRIGSYNVLNYFDEVDDPALSGRWDDADLASRPGQLVALAKAIRELDADVLALQEVESLEALLHFRDEHLADMGYRHVASLDAGYYRGVEQSILSRVPITETLNWPALSTADVVRKGEGFQPVPERPELAFQRSPLMVDLKTDDGYEFTLVVVHLKSGGLAHAYRREAEGLKLLEIVASRLGDDPSRNVIVLGDFNAKPEYKSMQLLVDGGLNDGMGHRVDDPSDAKFARWVTHESGRIIDYILVNDGAAREVVPRSGFVLGTFYPGDSNHYDWRTDDAPEAHASDHYPIAIDIIPRDLDGSAVVAPAE
jgi:endonuclease/exonuclease/phosphatase family metal-dependent hydrolase